MEYLVPNDKVTSNKRIASDNFSSCEVVSTCTESETDVSMSTSQKRGSGKSPPSQWVRAELEVIVECLNSEEWMDAHACGLEHSAFPELGMVQAMVKDSPYSNLCTALAREAATRAGDGNAYAVRPPMMIAFKIGEMLTHTRMVSGRQLAHLALSCVD